MSNNSGVALKNNPVDLIGKCNGRHVNCNAFVDRYNNPKTSGELTQELFIKYLTYLNTNGSYNSCINSYNNGSYQKIINFISENCLKFLIEPKLVGHIMTAMSDTQLLAVLKFQVSKDSSYIDKIIGVEIPNNGYGGYNNNTFISTIVTNYNSKKDSSKFVFNLIPVKQFLSILNKFKSNISTTNEELFSYYIKNNCKIMDNATCLSLINNLPYRSSIISELFKIISNNTMDIKIKTEILNKAIDNIDKNLIMTILETCKDITPTVEMVDSLTRRVYPNSSAMGASNSKIIADIIDIFVIYGMKITREIVIKLLNKTCYINNIEKYGIKIDEEILQICSNYSYYPYKFDIKPPKSVLIKECSKNNNLETLKKLKESGGVFTTDCLIEACKNRNNGKCIKYLVNDCEVKSNDECIKVFQETYHIEALDFIIKGYNTEKINQKTIKNFELDQNSTLVVEPREVKIENEIDYKLKNKIKKFFDYKKKTIKYLEVYELMLKYLINKKLIIGNYFIINDELSAILKLETSSILHIDQIKNIITYFIDVADSN